MVLPTPNLDDRSFDDLVAEALEILRQKGGDWTDLSPNDPGVVLIEAFAHLTELMLFRMNQLPDTAYCAFLELLGVHPFPPGAAHADLEFSLDAPAADNLTLPAGLQVAVEGVADSGTPDVFETLAPLVIFAGQSTGRVVAGHCVTHTGELLGRSTGKPRQSFRVRHAPILAPDQVGKHLIVAVEAGEGDDLTRDTTVDFDGRAFVAWTETRRFTPECAGQKVFRLDRFTGEVSFAPDLRMDVAADKLTATPQPLAAIPRSGAEIRIWYRTGGNGTGRVAANRLTGLTPRRAGLSVTNPAPAVAGRPVETLKHAMERGPLALHSLERAISARDFELLAQRASPGVNRALATADAGLWTYGTPGSVHVCLVPEIPDAPEHVTIEDLRRARHDGVLVQVSDDLTRRQALGTSNTVTWAKAKPVNIKLQAQLSPGQEPAEVESQIRARLDRLLSPLDRDGGKVGWPFGRSLFSWDVLRAIGDLPGVAGLSNIRLGVADAPDTEIATLSRDPYQKDTFYTAKANTVFRSGNRGQSWEQAARFDAETVEIVYAYTPTSGDDIRRAGLLCVVARQDEDSSRLYFSRDCGQTFEVLSQFQFEVNDIAWVFRDGAPSLLLAAKTGLFEVSAVAGSAPRQLLVKPDDPQMGVSAIEVSLDLQGRIIVAAAGATEEGVFLSTDGGESGTYEHVGLEGELVRVLMIQHTTTQRWLWAGVSAIGNDVGHGCLRAQIDSHGVGPDGWEPFSKGWVAGGCRALAHDGQRIYAGSLRRGVLVLEPDGESVEWRTPDVSCGLPLRDVSRLQPVSGIVAEDGFVMACGPQGSMRRKTLG